ncbi:hypothetical protein FGG08_002376 [Glutinoglossum americanum]|uniref:Uncharacterized protein n=1 Tax=Glutinoglossum americanum TaxID=1670608 RepID=A0A9P8I9G1_9PEZI|nr:hypothetical protein FGG08_002376 [Glutinoglossum americanum]
MGVASSSMTSYPIPKGSAGLTSKNPTESALEAPNRNQRAHCWEARDAFFKCLDESSIIDSVTNQDLAERQCGKEGVAFDENCASSWVQYFKKRRVMEHKRNETIEKLKAEGALPLPGGGSRAPSR